MPLYEYQCLKCNQRIELIQRHSDPAPTECEKCGGEMKKLHSAPAIQFKGSGFYKTDYASGSAAASTPAPSKSDSSTSAGAATGSESKSSSSDNASSSSSATKSESSSPSKTDGSASKSD